MQDTATCYIYYEAKILIKVHVKADFMLPIIMKLVTLQFGNSTLFICATTSTCDKYNEAKILIKVHIKADSIIHIHASLNVIILVTLQFGNDTLLISRIILLNLYTMKQKF